MNTNWVGTLQSFYIWPRKTFFNNKQHWKSRVFFFLPIPNQCFCTITILVACLLLLLLLGRLSLPLPGLQMKGAKPGITQKECWVKLQQEDRYCSIFSHDVLPRVLKFYPGQNSCCFKYLETRKHLMGKYI